MGAGSGTRRVARPVADPAWSLQPRPGCARRRGARKRCAAASRARRRIVGLRSPARCRSLPRTVHPPVAARSARAGVARRARPADAADGPRSDGVRGGTGLAGLRRGAAGRPRARALRPDRALGPATRRAGTGAGAFPGAGTRADGRRRRLAARGGVGAPRGAPPGAVGIAARRPAAAPLGRGSGGEEPRGPPRRRDGALDRARAAGAVARAAGRGPGRARGRRHVQGCGGALPREGPSPRGPSPEGPSPQGPPRRPHSTQSPATSRAAS